MSEITESLKQLPLDVWHRSHGARMVPFAGYEMPVQYEGVMAEHIWTRTEAGLFDVSHMGQVILSGENAAAALEKILPGEIQKLGIGKMRYSLLLAEDGGILDDLMITRVAHVDPEMGGSGREAGEHFYMVVNGAVKHSDLAYLRAQLPDAVRINYLEDRALLALQGPKAGAALKKLVPETAEKYFMEAGGFTWENAGRDVRLWISRSGYTGEDGFEISVAAEHAEVLATALCDLDEVRPIGLGARDSLRLEAGLPLYGHDMDENILPVEANLNFALHKRRRAEADFAGADRVLAQYPDKANKKRVGLFVDGRQPVREGATVVDGAGAAIGRVTSGGYAPTLGRPIAMAFVPAALSHTSTPITVEQRGRKIACTVADMPFVPNNYYRKPK